MSSHHIIRDSQEGSVLLLEEQSINMEVLDSYLEWSPIIVASQSVFSLLNSKGIKIDVLIADSDYLKKHDDEVSFQQPIDLIISSGKNTELESGISYLMSKKAHAINIFAHCDSHLKFKTQIAYHSISFTFLESNKASFVISNGHYEKWFPSGILITIIPFEVQQIFSLEHSGKTEKIFGKKVFEIVTSQDGNVRIVSGQNFIITELI